jgi:DNA-binding FadR family transcriptional regulator
MSPFLYDDISNQIEKAIRNMSPGDKLPSERTLSVQYGISRNILREALRSLSEKGLLEIKPGKGIYVANHENEKVVHRLETMLLKNQNGYRNRFIDIVEARTILELEIFAIAAERATEGDFRAIDEALENIQQCNGDVELFSRYDLEFHLRIAEATHNSVFPIFLKTLCEITGKQMFMFIRLNPDKIEVVQAEHREIAEAIRSRDKTRIANAGIHHFNMTEIIDGIAVSK